MSNLFEMRCPKCRSEDQIDIQAAVWVRLTQNGTDADASGCGDHYFDPKSPATCDACGYAGLVRDFKEEEEAEATPPALAADNKGNITGQLVRLIALCEQHGLDLDMLLSEAQHIHSGKPDVEESG